MIVDDELPVCKSISSALATENYIVDIALSAEEALRKEEASKHDVIVTDLMMPGLSGMDLLKRVKGKAPNTKVIMITGYPSIRSAVEAIKLGAFDYISKPFTPNELRSLVARALESKSYHERAEIALPPGIYCIPENSWAEIEEGGQVRIGVHHVFFETIDKVVHVELPKRGEMRYQGEACARLTDRSARVHRVWTPVSGIVVDVNDRLSDDCSQMSKDPYGEDWLLRVQATDLESDLENLVSVGR